MSDRLKKVIADLIIGVAIVALVFSLNQGQDMTLWHKLHNGCFVAGVLLMGMGGIRAIGNTGSFDAMGYSMKITLHTFLPLLGTGEREEDFLTYKERKAESRKSAADLLIAGGIYLGLSLIALALYYLV